MSLVPVTRTVQVTEQDIAQGKRKDCRSCPVALASARTFPELYAVEVFTQEIRAFNPPPDSPQRCSGGTVFALPGSVVDFVEAFDSKHEVKPFVFDLTLYVNEDKLTPPTT